MDSQNSPTQPTNDPFASNNGLNAPVAGQMPGMSILPNPGSVGTDLSAAPGQSSGAESSTGPMSEVSASTAQALAGDPAASGENGVTAQPTGFATANAAGVTPEVPAAPVANVAPTAESTAWSPEAASPATAAPMPEAVMQQAPVMPGPAPLDSTPAPGQQAPVAPRLPAKKSNKLLAVLIILLALAAAGFIVWWMYLR